jgi:diacylglycerol kinase (ATP)
MISLEFWAGEAGKLYPQHLKVCSLTLLSRYTTSDSLGDFLGYIEAHTEVSPLDRWQVRITPSLMGEVEQKTFVLNNYFSIGLDAQIALQFHKMREANPSLFVSRTLNKGIYGVYGVQKLVDAPPVLSEIGVEVLVSGEPLLPESLQKLQCIVWQNIPSYGGGSILWGDHNPSTEPHILPCKMDDGILEVVGLRDIAHVAGIQATVMSGTKLGQGHEFVITIEKECPIQVDGEPFTIGPSTIAITHLNKAQMLKRIKP